MYELIIVSVVVIVAVWYVGKILWKESKGQGCEGCDCSSKSNNAKKIVKIKNIGPKKL
ncbi:MAG: FeoB-associated Cys-rich membrane protein [Candidatus Zixiibacteriota bacterium]